MVPLADWGKEPELPQIQIKWGRRAAIAGGITAGLGIALAIIGWTTRGARNIYERSPAEFRSGGAGPSGRIERNPFD